MVIVLALVLSCTRPPVPKGENTVSYEAVEKRNRYRPEMQGYCLIRPGDKTIKARLMVTGESDTIHAALVDELGVPLAVVMATDTSMGLTRFFPPLNQSCATLFGLAVTAYFRSRRIVPMHNVVVRDNGFPDATADYYFSDNESDSSIIYLHKDVFSLLSGDNSFSLLDEKKKSVCLCVGE